MGNKSKDINNLYYIKKQIDDLVPGDIILHPIYRSDGLMLINKNKELSSSLISMMEKCTPATALVLVVPSREALHNFFKYNNSITEEFMQDAKHVTAELNRLTSASTNLFNTIQQEIGNDPLIDKEPTNQTSYNNNFFTDLLQNYPLWVTLDSKLESEKLKLRARHAKNELLASMSSNKTFIELFNRIKEYDDVLLIHSINTMCISLMIGLTLELNKSELFDLTVAALFSNVGFIEIEKKDFLSFLKTNEHIHEQLKRHLEVFSEMTMNFPELRKKSVIYGILDHHEYYNGKGYPKGKKGEEISLYGRILFIAHNYDELVGGYNYKLGLHPLDAYRIIYENIENRYDQNILNIFFHRTTYFKLGEPISLPNIQNGIIIGFDDFVNAPHLPKIKLESGQIINLAKS